MNPPSSPVTPSAEGRAPLIQIRGVDKVYRTPAGDFWALKQINVDIYPGEFVGVLGKSGSGKSTLGNMITGIDHPTRGTVCVGGARIHEMNEGRMSLWRGKNLGIVFQFFQLLPMLTVLENVLVPMDFGNRYRPAEREKRGLELLALVGLADLAERMPDELSGGQQQSVAIARALANDPPLILADEPTGNLDSRTSETVMDILEGLVRQGKTIMMVTHDTGLAQRTSRTLLLVDGELVHPAIAAAFARLPQRAMLALTHHAVDCHLEETGEGVRLAGLPGLRIITAGTGVLRRSGPPGEVEQRCPPGSILPPMEEDRVLSAQPGGPLKFMFIDAASLAGIQAEFPALSQALAEAAHIWREG